MKNLHVKDDIRVKKLGFFYMCIMSYKPDFLVTYTWQKLCTSIYPNKYTEMLTLNLQTTCEWSQKMCTYIRPYYPTVNLTEEMISDAAAIAECQGVIVEQKKANVKKKTFISIKMNFKTCETLHW